MSTPIVQCVRHLIDEYRRFLRSSYRLADPQLRDQFEQHVNEIDVLVKGPYVTLARDFATDKTLEKLVRDGVGHPDLLRLKWSFGKNSIYRHQEEAFRLVEEKSRNCIVKTGTGSGKTEAFFLSLLSGVLRLRDKGIKGNKAIIIYPMNALANDQLVRLRNLIRDSGVNLTFGMYTGESETVAHTLGDPVEGNEVIERDRIRKEPPDIILTNYKELEFMLIRKADRPIFTSSLRYLILDEIHTYRGALATEIACLIRRLKSRAELKEGQLRCIGTSATVSEGAGGDAALVKFVSSLFGETFEACDIVGESHVDHPRSARPYLPPMVKVEVGELDGNDPGAALELATKITGKPPPREGSLPRRIATMFDGNQLIDFLSAECVKPFALSELGALLVQRFPEAARLSEGERASLIEAYLLVGSMGSDDDPPPLRPKLHTFFHGIYDVGICLNPDCRRLIRDGSDVCPQCQSVVRPAALCRTCGQDFAKVRFVEDSSKPPLADDSFTSNPSTGFITPRIHVEADEREEEEDDDASGQGAKRKKVASKSKLTDVWVCHGCGMVHEEETSRCAHCEKGGMIVRQKILRGPVHTCPVCNGRYPRGEILTLLRSGVASSNSLLATHHIDWLEESDRKLLMFSDNRQDAAYQAGYMNDRHRLFALRHAIYDVVGDKGIAFADLPHLLLTRFQEMQLASKRLVKAEQEKWIRTLKIEAAGEFCRSTHQRISLENLALVEVQYEFLDEFGKDERFLSLCTSSGIGREDAAILVRAILDRMRRSRAVAFEFFQEYIDPSKEKWRLLDVEPYNLVIPEYERRPVFYMLDRNEVARNGVGGFKFDALTRDSRYGMAAVPKMLQRAGIPESAWNHWMRTVVKLLLEYEIVEYAGHLPSSVRGKIGPERPLQISPRVLRLSRAGKGFRCQKCQIWHPYKGTACYSTSCSGTKGDLVEISPDFDHYYVRMYTGGRPRKMAVAEHTAQIDQDQRAEREKDFKATRLNVLVCSPTLELGVDIGDLQTVLLRNGPPTPANYIQRAGRAGRRLRIGFVSTFCDMGPHDRHCFEDPAWLVRGEFQPPTIRFENNLIMARHVRSYVLERLESEFPNLMGDMVDDLDKPGQLDRAAIDKVFGEVKAKSADLVGGAVTTFGISDAKGMNDIIAQIPADVNLILENWFSLIKRISDEYHYYNPITADRKAQQLAAARRRAYRELTTDRRSAYVLNYLASEGFLPSYQFPTDTFNLEPGVHDTSTLRRPAWVALFEFAPGNMVYANGHKLKTIRALFEGKNKSLVGETKGGIEASGRVRSFCFCKQCGYASDLTLNDCPQCGKGLDDPIEVAFIEAFEAEENTQISSSEESRQRVYFERREHLLQNEDATVEIYPFPFSRLEMYRRARILVTNWGKRQGHAAEGERFILCPFCGKHQPGAQTAKERARWEKEHRARCTGTPMPYVLGYDFTADTLILPVTSAMRDGVQEETFARTFGTAMVAGAVELLEIEPDEIAFFYHKAANEGIEVIFYETAPGGAGYLEKLAGNLPEWADIASKRLFNHDCVKACYRCLKSYRNQSFHNQLDKRNVRDILFQFANSGMTGPSCHAKRCDGIKQTEKWMQEISAQTPTEGTVIERKLQGAIKHGGRLPEPVAQRPIKKGDALITVADFAYEEEKIAIYCDGFAYHGTKEKLAADADKRNFLQSDGWAVLTFWGKTILKHPDRCEEQIWQMYRMRKLQKETSK